MIALDHTHHAQAKSWVASANRHAEFPIQNLPFGIFSSADEQPRGGVAIGDKILDLHAALRSGLFTGAARDSAEAAANPTLNEFVSRGAAARQALRRAVFELLADGTTARVRVDSCLRAAADCTLHLPVTIGDYTDFYAGIHHATNVGKLFRPDKPLLPNYKYVPIGYHGRASSIVVSGAPVRRPSGQIKAPNVDFPQYGPSQRLDYELELGIWVGAGNPLGQPVDIAAADQHIAGYSLLNDWSARDIQTWEYQPLGPFLAKSFATSVSSWIVTPEALAPFRRAQLARPTGDPAPLAYLWSESDQREGALDIELEVLLSTTRSRALGLPPHRIALSNSCHMYWTSAQLVAHHTSNGCNLRPGDLLGTGTLSGPTGDACGSLLEATQGGTKPLLLPSGEQRRYLEQGDEVILQAHCRRQGFASIGFGECRATVQAD